MDKLANRMIKADKQIKMADLQFVDFALMPGPVRKEKQFSLLDDFSNLDVPIFSRTSHSASGVSALFRVFTTRKDHCSAIRKIFYTTSAKQETSSFSCSEVVEIVAH